MVDKWEPWVWYPEIWPTKSKFFTYLRGSLRKAVWNLSPIKISYKNSVCGPPPEGYTGKAKSGAYCALSGEWEGKSKLQIDHVNGNVPLNDEEDILGFLKHLVPPPNSLQPVTKEAHKIKSHAEKRGIPYQQAVIEKEVISVCKGRGNPEIPWLEERGIIPATNKTKRKEQVRKYLEENKFGQ